MTSAIFSLDNDLMGAFAFYATLVIVKMAFMTTLTSITRNLTNAHANPEDLRFTNKLRGIPSDKGKTTVSQEDVERVRRIHLNDLENVIPFVLVGFFYILTHPSYSSALWHFRIFVGSRFLHTITYQFALPQPSRAAMFLIGYLVFISMAIQILMKTM